MSQTQQDKWPENVGIVAIEVYFPSTYVSQKELEKYDCVSEGKYTIGLGQQAMGFCEDREDINSMCLTAVKGLLEKNKVAMSHVGRLEVGTETIIDKSKSVKTVLMQLFEESGNTDIEGIDTTNACYGGTAALFNALNWIESSSWDGRYAVVVMGDIAVYAEGNARCTGGAGAIAFLVGKDAPLVIDRKLRGSHMQHVYDFYKPDMVSEYPVVDGKLSIKCFLNALDKCYERYLKSAEKHLGNDKKISTLEDVDFFIFHTPFCKMVQKSLARCMFQDFLNQKDETIKESEDKYADLLKYRGISLRETLENDVLYKEVERSSVKCSNNLFNRITKPSLLLAQNIGNMYTPSLYGGLVSLLISIAEEDLINKRVVLFSYGSGLASSMFSLTICPDEVHRLKLLKIIYQMQKVNQKLEERIEIEPASFVEILKRREDTHHLSDYEPSASVDNLWPATYYLTHVDKQFRRFYARKQRERNALNLNSLGSRCDFL
eukprot:gene7686-8523_t